MYEKTRQQKLEAEAVRKELEKYSQYGEGGKRGRGPEKPPEVLRTPMDIRKNPKFDGQTVFLITYVPLKCKDERTPVDPLALREWMLFALVEEDPFAKKFHIEIDRYKLLMEEVDQQIVRIPRMLFLNPDGSKMSDIEAREQRELLFEKFGAERVEHEAKISEVERNLAAHVEWRRKMGISFTKGAVDNNTATCSWMVRFYGTDDAKEMEDLLIKKRNWPGIKLAAGRGGIIDPCPPWAGRGDLPDGSKEHMKDYTGLQINVGGARIARVPQGVGLYRTLDRESSTIADKDFSIYYGDYDAGKKSGYGIDINDACVFVGSFENDRKVGRGRIDYADGTTIVGPFGTTKDNKCPEASEFVNPYMDGEPNGLVEINFSDGAFFRGNMVNGRINGQGDYQSALNEVLSGTFENGLLHCDNGFMQNYAKETFTGKFIHGELHGKGMHMNERGDFFDGHYEHFLRHGKGYAKCAKTGTYRGYHIYGLKHGKGAIEYEYQAPKKVKKKVKIVNSNDDEDNSQSLPDSSSINEQEVEKDSKYKDAPDPNHVELANEFRRIYQGFFIGDSIASGGCIMDTKIQVPMVIAKRNRRGNLPIIKVAKKMERIAHQCKLMEEKYTDMEHHIRDELRKKKIRIYNQQKHFTKDNLQNFMAGMDSKAIGSPEIKKKVRAARMQDLTIDKHQFKKAVIPRLRVIDNSAVSHLSDAFKRIKPDEDDIENGDYNIDDHVLRLALSDFEEVHERQRFLKYDQIWQRAEEAFAARKKPNI